MNKGGEVLWSGNKQMAHTFYPSHNDPPSITSGIYILYWRKGQKLFGGSAGVTWK